MPTGPFRTARVARFADFELDLRAAELRRDGSRVRLQEQPFRILAILLEHPGEVVMREEIRKLLWPNDTAVEIGHGINAAVLRLREALGESAGNPRFIETLPRRGYRFNGRVEWEQGPPIARPAPGSSPPGLTGRTVSHYRVLDRLGSGGMGVVYRAEDLQLGRLVALKFLSPEFAEDPDARSRFQKEARAASALNHPNVCTVYSVEEWEGQPFISMELVEGETLTARLAKGPVPAATARALAIQVTAALEAAHRKGIVHRDLKPANLMVTESGVKVLDFGIAKMDRGVPTRRGEVVGTPQYMSPEQTRGVAVDARSDIYSLGLVLREMLAGSQIPPPLERVLARCLAEDPQARWQTAGELKAQLERVPVAEPRRRSRLAIAIAVTVALLCLAVLTAKIPPRHAPVEFVLTGPVEAKGTSLKLAPDGRTLAFVSGGRHYLQALGRSAAQLLLVPSGSGVPFWAPDERSIAIATGNQLVRVATAPNSISSELARVNTRLDGAWGPDDTILIGLVNDGLYRISAGGGVLTRVTVPDAQRGETRHLMPQFLPDGHRFLFIAGSDTPGYSRLWAASLDSPERTEVMPMQSNFVFVPFHPRDPQGTLVYLRDGVLVAQDFDSLKLRPIGEARALAPLPAAHLAIGAQVSRGEFSATPSTLVYRSGESITVVRNWR